MMLLSSAPAPHSAHRFAPAQASSGLRSLLLAPDDAAAAPRGGLVTRAAAVAVAVAVAARAADAQESRDDAASADDDAEDEEEDGEEGSEEEEEDEGCWVSYGRRRPRRRLPPPIPSLVALRRARTGDGRLVIRMVPVARPDYVHARRRGGRLTMQLVERDDEPSSAPMAAPPLQAPAIASARQGDDGTAPGADDHDVAGPAPAAGGLADDEQAPASPRGILSPAVAPRRVSSVGCFGDVFKYNSIASSSLHRMSSLRMVH
ncbi:hypothetical protein ACP4OV_000302 [Aristida adscensionis]